MLYQVHSLAVCYLGAIGLLLSALVPATVVVIVEVLQSGTPCACITVARTDLSAIWLLLLLGLCWLLLHFVAEADNQAMHIWVSRAC